MTVERLAIEGCAAVVLGCAVLLGSCTGDARPEACCNGPRPGTW